MSENFMFDCFCNLSQNFDNDSKENCIEETVKEESELTDKEFSALYFLDKKSDVSIENIKYVKDKNTDNKKTNEETQTLVIEGGQKLNILDQTKENYSQIKIELKQNGKNIKAAKLNGKIRKALKIFDIEKTKKKNIKKGRMTKDLKKNFLGIHNKFSQDNIIRKIKASFIEKSMNYINKQFSIHLKRRGIKKYYRLIQRISPSESRKIRKSENLDFLETPLKTIFSSSLSKKCSLYEPDYNKKQIEKLYLENEAKDVIKTLDMPVGDMYDKYCKNIKMDGFGTLEDDLIEERLKMEEKKENNIDEYLKKYKYTAENYRHIFDEKKSRISKKKVSLF